MRSQVTIENIEEMRRREGIHDLELQKQIRGLRVGDCVKLTLSINVAPLAGETLLVRITSIRGVAYRGRLVSQPASPRLSELRVGLLMTFTTAHIHSLPKSGPSHED